MRRVLKSALTQRQPPLKTGGMAAWYAGADEIAAAAFLEGRGELATEGAEMQSLQNEKDGLRTVCPPGVHSPPPS